jgi:hypothetical protein
MRDLLLALVRPRLSEAGRRWLDATLDGLRAEVTAARLLNLYTGAPRYVGRAALALNEVEAARRRLREADPDLSLAQWTVEDGVRALLLLQAAETLGGDERPGGPGGFDALALACYEQGDAREQQSWLRALALMPAPGRFRATAIDACRTNILPVFEAIACENPFPKRHFAELNFNQMVLKAFFNGVAVSRIVGLEARLNPELARMADDYVSEREAAGRSVPPDIWLVLAPGPRRERLAPAGAAGILSREPIA